MVSTEDALRPTDVAAALDRLAAAESVESNCMFQLALMVARIAVEPCSEDYKDGAAQALMGLIRAKPKTDVARLFGTATPRGQMREGRRATA